MIAGVIVSAERTAGVWLDLDTGDHGPVVDSDVSGSWDTATSVQADAAGISVSAGTDTDDDSDYVTVSLALFDQLLRMRAACTCGAGK